MKKEKKDKKFGIVLLVLGLLLAFTFKDKIMDIFNEVTKPISEKPVIYLYPEDELDVSVSLEVNGDFICTYPNYDGQWNVTAYSDGRLVDKKSGFEYSYLYWEGILDTQYDMTKGYVVAGEDTADFLRDILEKLGLTPREYNEFIVFWLPRMQNNPYNLITFQKEAYTNNAVLDINPEPESILRIYMVYQALDAPIDIEQPQIEPFERKGFTVIEWGGCEIR